MRQRKMPIVQNIRAKTRELSSPVWSGCLGIIGNSKLLILVFLMSILVPPGGMAKT